MILAPLPRRQIGFAAPSFGTLPMESALDGSPSLASGASAFAPVVPTLPDARGPSLATVWVRSGCPAIRELAIYHSTTRLGSGPDNDLVLPAESVGAMHAELRLREGVWLYGDLDSPTGSWIDGTRVVEPMPLGPGSTIQIGEVVLTFLPRDRSDVAPTATPRLVSADATPRGLPRWAIYALGTAAVLLLAYLLFGRR